MNEWWIYCTGEQREQGGGGNCCVRLLSQKVEPQWFTFHHQASRVWSAELQIVYPRVVLQYEKLKSTFNCQYLGYSIFWLFSLQRLYGYILWLLLCLYRRYKKNLKPASSIRSDLGAGEDLSILQKPKTVFAVRVHFFDCQGWTELLRIWDAGSRLKTRITQRRPKYVIPWILFTTLGNFKLWKSCIIFLYYWTHQK